MEVDTPTLCTRERCGLCHHISPIGFWVPNEIWDAVVHPHYHEAIHCLQCFTDRADAKLIEWDRDIQFYPVSFVAHLRRAHEDTLAASVPDEETNQ